MAIEDPPTSLRTYPGKNQRALHWQQLNRKLFQHKSWLGEQTCHESQEGEADAAEKAIEQSQILF